MDSIYYQLENLAIIDENGTTYQSPVVEIQVMVGARGAFLQLYMQAYSSLAAIENRLHPLFVPNFPYSFMRETDDVYSGPVPGPAGVETFGLPYLIEQLTAVFAANEMMKYPQFLDGVGAPYSETNPPTIQWRRVYPIFSEPQQP